MNKVLLVGNGFDLAHGLLTSYNDFLFLMQNWDHFKLEYEEKIQEGGFYKYLTHADNLDNQKIDELDEIMRTNSWVHYFCKCGAEIDGWIDFEKEIYPVMELFDHIFNLDCNIEVNRVHKFLESQIKKNNMEFKMSRLIKLWKNYIWTGGEEYITIESKYLSEQYGVLKKKILKSLKEEFDEFIYAFEIYLHEFVYKKEDIKLIKQIDRINADYVISFNYTLTEKLYGISEQKTHHIHGSIREDLEQGTSNMVLGVNEQEKQNFDFIYFVKYFQRIQKRTGTNYKKFLKECGYKGQGWTIDNKSGYNLHIYGHSLDITDADILKYAINGAKQINIYYYDQTDFESKVINLIALYGREVVEENIESGYFEFVPTSDEKV